MHIEIVGDESISRQARTYAEYHLFAALSQAIDTREVRSASLVLRRAKSRRHLDSVVCTVTVELNSGEVGRLRACGGHPHAAINRAADVSYPTPSPFGTIHRNAKWSPANEAGMGLGLVPCPYRAISAARSSTHTFEGLS